MYGTLVQAGSGLPDLPHPASVSPAPNDPLCYHSKTGAVVRLPNYSPGLPPTDLVTHGDYRIRARPISPNRPSPQTKSQARFQIDVCIQNQIVRRQRYETGTASLTEAVDTASAWIRRRQSTDRFSFLLSLNLIVIWCLLIATAWFLFPLVSWVSFAPLFVCFPISLACAPPRRH